MNGATLRHHSLATAGNTRGFHWSLTSVTSPARWVQISTSTFTSSCAYRGVRCVRVMRSYGQILVFRTRMAIVSTIRHLLCG